MVKKEEDSITVEYLKHHETFNKKYIDGKTLVLMQVGKFYESYFDGTHGPDTSKLEEITDAIASRRNKSIEAISIKNPIMWGVPTESTNKYFPLLLNAGYYLVIFDQVGVGKNITRELAAVYSPSTYLNNIYKPDSNYITGVYLEEILSKTNKKFLYYCGIVATDLSTGCVYVHEALSTDEDRDFGFDEVNRFINTLQPKEVIVFKNNISILDEDILKTFNLNTRSHQIKEVDQVKLKIPYQRKILEDIYLKKKSLISIFETVGIEKDIYAKNALVLLLEFISNQSLNLIKELDIPTHLFSANYLTLGNDAITQLDIIPPFSMNKDTISDTKIRTLIDIINVASTPMGKRFVKRCITSPYINSKKLNEIYKIVDILMQNNFFKGVDIFLAKIKDVERYERKLIMGTLHPMSMVELMTSYVVIFDMFKHIKSNNTAAAFIQTASLRKKIEKFNKKLDGLIDKDKAKLYTIDKIKQNIFKKGIYPNIDKLEEEIGLSENSMYQLLDILDGYINDKPEKMISLKSDKIGSHYYKLTSKRCELLEAKLNDIEEIELEDMTINVKDLSFDYNKNDVKITSPFLKAQAKDINGLREKITAETLKKYQELMKEFIDEFSECLKDTNKMVTQIDYYICIAKVASEHNYCRPTIDETAEDSYIECKNLRHPVVERIIDTEYIPHDVTVGKDLKGMILYGLNNSGKSILMRAIGISVIMAQAGFYVSASQFKYRPYESLYTRIIGTDNLLEGKGFFTCEMIETKSILKRADNRILVLSDELCRGTESLSGTAIVGSVVLNLVKRNASLIFTSHLHDLFDLDKIKECQQIKAFHLSTDIVDGKITYDRKLLDGYGLRNYGLIVANNIIDDKEFSQTALEIQNILMDKKEKQSRYNSSLIINKCDICGIGKSSKLETHHINHQKDCDEKGFVKTSGKEHIKKNDIFNLISVCQKCHDKIHADVIEVEGYKASSEGKKLIVNRKIK